MDLAMGEIYKVGKWSVYGSWGVGVIEGVIWIFRSEVGEGFGWNEGS